MGHRRHSSGPVKKITETRWSGNVFTFAALASGATAALTLVTAATDTETLLRLRGELCCYLDAAQGPGSLQAVAIGAIVMPQGQGTTVVSSPFADDNAPWLFYEQFVIGYEEMVTDVVDVPGLPIFRKTIDVKAMRILRPDREVQLVVESVSVIGGGPSINLNATFRALFGS